MYFLRSHLIRYGTNFVKQSQVLHCWCIQTQKNLQFHLDTSLLASKKQDDNSAMKPTPDDGTWVGPPHPVAQLRVKVFPESQDLTKEERAFYAQSKETQEWNLLYWEAHNKDFHESRKLFIDKMAKEKNLTRDEVAQSDDMALFYEHFLKRNYSKHVTYNWNWYRKNLKLLYLSAKANVSKVKRIFS